MKNTAKKLIGWIIFIVYIAVTLYMLFFAGELGRGHLKESYTYNLQLFKEINRFIAWSRESEVGFRAMMTNVVGNVVFFIPFGILLPINVKKLRRFISVVLITFLFSLSIETVQLITRTGAFDVDDILLNTIGGAVGYILYVLVDWIKAKVQ